MSQQHPGSANPAEANDNADDAPAEPQQTSLLKNGALQIAIFNSTNFSSIATDEGGVIRTFNVGAERMLGYAAGEVVNHLTPADISDPEELLARSGALSQDLGVPIAAGFEALAWKASRGIEDIFELTWIRKDGTRLPAVVSVTALRDAGENIIGYLLIGTDNSAQKHADAIQKQLSRHLLDRQFHVLTEGGKGNKTEAEFNAATFSEGDSRPQAAVVPDVTESGQLERELAQMRFELGRARLEAEKANLAKTEFLSRVSHDLRSPLNTILGFAQLIDSDTPPPTLAQTASVEQILRAGWHLLDLINEILDLAQIEAGKLLLSLEPISMTEILRECEALYLPRGGKRGVRFTFPHLAGPNFVSADRTQVRRILVNLMANAIQFNRPNGTVAVECTAIPGTGQAPERIRVSIRDTGPGLTPEKLGALFEPFNRLGQERGAQKGGGIGLVMSRRLVDLMGGALTAESRVGHGSVFYLELESAAPPRLEFGAKQPPAITIEHPAAQPVCRTVLYVEDDLSNLELVEQLLERRFDIRLISTLDGLEGVRLALAHQPDVILMDLHLPGISGREALKRIRLDPATAHIPVIALTANAIRKDMESALREGFFSYVTKPFHVDKLMDTLDQALELAAQRGAGK